MKESVEFEPLREFHFNLLHKWLNKPHVQAYYSLRAWTLEEVKEKFLPYVNGEKLIKGYIVSSSNHPFGYIQSYPLEEYPFEDQDLLISIVEKAAGIDLFIGEEKELDKGLGSLIINIFLEKFIWPNYQYCLADPDIRNVASLRLFKRCGFKEHASIHSKDALGNQAAYLLFIKDSPLME